MKTFLQLTDIQPRIPELQFKAPVSWRVNEEECWAIVGNNGAGKSILTNLIAGKQALKCGEISYRFLEGTDLRPWQAVQVLAFDSVYGLADFRNTYYQQRWHSSENDDMPNVGEILGSEGNSELFSLFGVNEFLEKKINFLSSGELRKTLITKSLLEKPRLLIIDNPYIGLDVASRALLKESLQQLSHYSGTRLIFVLSDTHDIPEFVTHVLPLEERQALAPLEKDKFRQAYPSKILETFPLSEVKGGEELVIDLQKITIRYAEKIVLKEIDWQVARGEKWLLSGPNGSGKSTLLSLINADHPQAYANEIRVFGQKRGVGQSIWEVKKRIGYVSPEMHTHYYQNITALDVVGSGLFDTIGTVHRCNEEQIRQSLVWMERFGINSLKEKSFIKLSSGEQRLVLLARAFVKEPELLILDEPLHGLDVANKIRVRDLIDEYAQMEGKTLIYVSHYLNEIPRCINRHLELKKEGQH